MKIGKYICLSAEMGFFALDGGAMFGVVPKVLWEKKIPPDRSNMIPMNTRTLLVQGNNRNILIDTGMGNKFSDKFRQMYKVDNSFGSTNEILLSKGLIAEDITDVIISHLHFDHAGGATMNIDGKTVPSFSNAKYYVQKSQWENALNPLARDSASYMKENFIPLEQHGNLELLDGPCTLFDDIEIIVTNGHTAGQQHALIKGETESLFFCGDICPTSAHIPEKWLMAYDNEPILAISEKTKLYARAVKENWILFFEHDPIVAASTIIKGDKGYKMGKKVEI